MQQKQYLGERQVAELTGFAIQTLRNNRFQGKGFPYRKIGRSIRYEYTEIIAYMDAYFIKTNASVTSKQKINS